ncbi:hypothetical protein LDENG_00136550 [Lucifuga dentata]|nr:hypothetical protein LDENG_00136550 [Lucifuga dentata]
MERWRGRVALVTGASVGIGAAVVRALIKNGMRVVGCARSVDKIEQCVSLHCNPWSPLQKTTVVQGGMSKEAEVFESSTDWRREGEECAHKKKPQTKHCLHTYTHAHTTECGAGVDSAVEKEPWKGRVTMVTEPQLGLERLLPGH